MFLTKFIVDSVLVLSFSVWMFHIFPYKWNVRMGCLEAKLFFKSCAQIFMFLQIVFNKWEQSTLHLPYKHWLCKCYKVYDDYIEFDTEKTENTKSAVRD